MTGKKSEYLVTEHSALSFSFWPNRVTALSGASGLVHIESTKSVAVRQLAPNSLCHEPLRTKAVLINRISHNMAINPSRCLNS